MFVSRSGNGSLQIASPSVATIENGGFTPVFLHLCYDFERLYQKKNNKEKGILRSTHDEVSFIRILFPA